MSNSYMTRQFELPDIQEEPDDDGFYNDIKSSPNNFSFWFPKIKDCGLSAPESVIVSVPKDVVRSQFLEREGDADRIHEFVAGNVMPLIPDGWDKIFVKNGSFSDKFSFRFCTPDRSVDSVAESFKLINQDSLCFDRGGNAEFVIRRFVEASAEENLHKIYDGMPLRNEIRVFFDFDRKRTLYAVNYWDWDYCHEGIGLIDGDGMIYEDAYPGLDSFFQEHVGEVKSLAEEYLCNVRGIRGVWSVDFMFADGKWWLIDMAVGHMSAYFDFDRCAAMQESLDKESGREWTRFADRRPEPDTTVLVKRDGALPFRSDGFGVVDGKESWCLMWGNIVRNLEILPEDGWSLVSN